MNEHEVTREFERRLAEYTGAPIVIAVDNCCNALFLCLRYLAQGRTPKTPIFIPRHTYIGVPYAIRAAGYKVAVDEDAEASTPGHLKGEYQLKPLPLWDAALRLTSGMYRKGQMQCLSFTGPFKHLKIQKGGAILLDDPAAEQWLRIAGFSGRHYVSYHNDTFGHSEGYNFYLPSMLSTLGLQLMAGLPAHNPDLVLPYPDWSIHPAFCNTYADTPQNQ